MDDDAFNLLFGLVGLLFAAFGTAGAVLVAVRLLRHRRALAGGLPAEATVVDTYVTRQGAHGAEATEPWATRTVRHAVLEFATAEGHRVRFEEVSGALHLVDDVVRVRYPADHPEGAVCLAPEAVAGGAGALLLMALCAVFTCCGLFFAASGLTGG